MAFDAARFMYLKPKYLKTLSKESQEVFNHLHKDEQLLILTAWAEKRYLELSKIAVWKNIQDCMYGKWYETF